MSATLDRILADKREHIVREKLRKPLSSMAPAADTPRGFAAALRAARAAGRTGLIAEIKKASPSKGLIRADFDPPALARAYAEGGATCLSVLTDVPHFMGDDAYLAAARAACGLPVLRKDFMLDPWQVAESRALGADAILVILAAVDDGLAAELIAAAADHGMDVLVEVHDRVERDRALALGVTLLGINNRNLKTMAVSLETSIELASDTPADILVVAESGLATPADLARLRAEAGITTVLIGEALMRQADVAAATRALLA